MSQSKSPIPGSHSSTTSESSDARSWRYPTRKICWTPHALPRAPNADGRPVWEPPIFDYSPLIDEEYEKKREAMLKWRKGDVVSTTEIMDVDTEYELLHQYIDWAEDNEACSEDTESRDFFRGLCKEIDQDWGEVAAEMRKTGYIIFGKKEDGNYEILGVFGQLLKPGQALYDRGSDYDRQRPTEHSQSEATDSDVAFSSAIHNLFGEAQSPLDPQSIYSPSEDNDEGSLITFSDTDSAIPSPINHNHPPLLPHRPHSPADDADDEEDLITFSDSDSESPIARNAAQPQGERPSDDLNLLIPDVDDERESITFSALDLESAILGHDDGGGAGVPQRSKVGKDGEEGTLIAFSESEGSNEDEHGEEQQASGRGQAAQLRGMPLALRLMGLRSHTTGNGREDGTEQEDVDEEDLD